jgi:putative ABC transport system substrate-binding protein
VPRFLDLLLGLAMALALALPTPGLLAAGAIPHVVIVQSDRIPPYEQARRGIEAGLQASGLQAGRSLLLKIMTMGFGEAVDPERSIPFYIKRNNPDLVLLVGSAAGKLAVEKFPDVPLVFCMVFRPRAVGLLDSPLRSSGVSLEVPPAVMLDHIADYVPGLQRLGLLYDHRQDEVLATQTMLEAANRKLTVIDSPIREHTDIPQALQRLFGSAQAICVFPSERVFGKAIMERLLHQALIQRIPVCGTSRKHVRYGALFAITPDWRAVGEQTGELAAEILRGDAELQPFRLIPPRKWSLLVNLKISELLGLKPPASWVERAQFYTP